MAIPSSANKPSRLQRLASTWQEALLASGTAAAGWALSHLLLGHRSPIFAPIAALVCLAPGVAARGRQAIRMLIGVAIGIAVGDAALALNATPSWYWLGGATAIAMLAASTVGVTAVTFIQAGASVVIVIASGRAAGIERFTDCAVGGVLGLFVSQVLLSPDPIALLEKSANAVNTDLDEGWKRARTALETQDAATGESALAAFEAALRAVTILEDAIAHARGIVEWTVRGRLMTKRVSAEVARYERTVLRSCAASISFGMALVDALRDPETSAPPRQLIEAASTEGHESLALDGPAQWRAVIVAMNAVLAQRRQG